MDEDEALAAAAQADMRIEVVKREINQGALAGFDSEITDYAARLVIAALDSFDAQQQQRSYAVGFRQGVAFERFRRDQMGWPESA